jgi:predicted LPLAT superfamily acyltransferase
MTGRFLPCVLVPTYNHVQALPALLQHMADLALPVVIVDDGSGAEQRRAIDRLVETTHASAWCLRHDHNQGKGAAVLHGLRDAAARGFSHVFQIDADGQHDLAAVAGFLEAARMYPEAIIAGTPIFDRSITRGRRMGRLVTDFWVAVHTLSLQISDSMCGFRVYPVAPSLALANRTSIGRRMDFDIEILVRLFWAGIPVAMLPVKVTYPRDNFSNFGMLRDNIAISLTHTRLFFGMLRRLPRILRNQPPRIDLISQRGRHWADHCERGTYFGLLILAAVHRLLGRRACLLMMTPVVLYFFATGREARRASKDYLRRLRAAGHLRRAPWLIDQIRHFMSFATSSLDMVAAWTGGIRPTMVRGIEGGTFAAAKNADRGAVVLSAHLGNPEIIRAVAHLAKRWRVNVLVHTVHAERFNRLITSIAPDARVRLIQVTDLGVDKAVLLKEAVDRGEWVVLMADRIPVGTSGRVSWVPFLGELAPFPQGPFILAAVLKAPVFTMFCLREGGTYRIWFERLSDRLELPRSERAERLRDAMEIFVSRLEARLIRAPLQWYNFFDFWRPQGLEPPAPGQVNLQRPRSRILQAAPGGDPADGRRRTSSTGSCLR